MGENFVKKKRPPVINRAASVFGFSIPGRMPDVKSI
jgi:hypothetical protein